MNYAKQRDSNEREIVRALEHVGATVTRLSDAGVPDLLVGRAGRTWLLEVKLPLGARGGTSQHREAEGGRGDLTAAQVRWWDAWRGERAVVVRSADEALRAIGVELQNRATLPLAVDPAGSAGVARERSFRASQHGKRGNQ